MKKSTFIIPLLALTLACSEEDMYVEPLDGVGQMSQVVNPANADDVFIVVEKQTTFPGGQVAWSEFLSKNLTYPEQAKSMGIEGSVYLSFVVDEIGKVSDITVSRGVGAGCDQEAIRMLQESPNWIPGEQRGRAVKSKMAIRIVFKLGSPSAAANDTNVKTVNLDVQK